MPENGSSRPVPWDGEDELSKALKSLSSSRQISAHKVKDIAKLCLKNVKEYKRVVHAVERSVRKSRPEYRVGGCYVIDSICRQSQARHGDKDPFTPRFAQRMASETVALFREVKGKDRQSISRIVRGWNNLNMFGYLEGFEEDGHHAESGLESPVLAPFIQDRDSAGVEDFALATETTPAPAPAATPAVVPVAPVEAKDTAGKPSENVSNWMSILSHVQTPQQVPAPPEQLSTQQEKPDAHGHSAQARPNGPAGPSAWPPANQQSPPFASASSWQAQQQHQQHQFPLNGGAQQQQQQPPTFGRSGNECGHEARELPAAQQDKGKPARDSSSSFSAAPETKKRRRTTRWAPAVDKGETLPTPTFQQQQQHQQQQHLPTAPNGTAASPPPRLLQQQQDSRAAPPPPPPPPLIPVGAQSQGAFPAPRQYDPMMTAGAGAGRGNWPPRPPWGWQAPPPPPHPHAWPRGVDPPPPPVPPPGPWQSGAQLPPPPLPPNGLGPVPAAPPTAPVAPASTAEDQPAAPKAESKSNSGSTKLIMTKITDEDWSDGSIEPEEEEEGAGDDLYGGLG